MGVVRTVAMIGCGNRARAHVPGLLAESRCKIVGLSDVRAEAAEAMKKDFALDVPTFTDHEEMLAKLKPEIVVACLWTPLHLPVFRDCTEAGVKAVLSEKPMAPTWGECKTMAQLAQASGCILNFCHQRRFSKGNQLVRRMIAEGMFGRPERVDRYSPQNLLDCGTHSLDQAASYLSEARVKWVMGAADTQQLIKWFNVSAEGMFTGTLVYDNGVRGTIQCGGPDMDMWGGVRVTGSEGFIEVMWDGDIRRAVRYKDPAWVAPKVEDKSDEFVGRMISDVVNCMETQREPECSYQKALRASETIFAFYESLRRHQRVELPLKEVEDNPFLSMLDAGEFSRGHGRCKSVAVKV